MSEATEEFARLVEVARNAADAGGLAAVAPVFVEMPAELAEQLERGGMLTLPPEKAVGFMGGQLWKVKELAPLLKVNPQTLYAWITAGSVRVIRTPGGRIRIPAEEAFRLLSVGLEDSQDSPLT